MLALVLLILGGCAASPRTLPRHEFTRVCMGVQTRIVTYARDYQSAEVAAAKAFARIAQLDAIMSDYRQDSEVMRLCRTPGTTTPLSADLLRVLVDARRVADASQGAFDVTLGPATSLWRQARQTGRLPDAPTLQTVRKLINFRNIELDIQAGTARIAKPGTRIDLGGIAKCDAAEQARNVLVAEGLRQSLVALAGDIAVADPPPGQTGWHIAIDQRVTPWSRVALNQDPGIPRLLVVRNTCVSTSGDAEQFVEIEGNRYAHIVDPRTALGTPGGVSATVTHPKGTLADALATALCVVGEAEAEELIQVFGAAAVIRDLRDRVPRNRIIDPQELINFSHPAVQTRQ